MRAFPASARFFVATAVLFLLQFIPFVGIFLMMLMAMFWSVLLINAGMLGTAWEAATGRVSRWWLVLPIAFYATYFGFAAADAWTLRQLGASYDLANAKVAVPFDAERQALAFEQDGDGASWLVQNYRLQVAYSRNPNYRERFRSHRMVTSEICREIGASWAQRAIGISTFGFHDGDTIASRKMEKRFCDFAMPERPALPLTTVARQEHKFLHGSLPITRVTTTVTTPDGRRFRLLGGVAAPLHWIPMPVIGCGLNSARPKWECDAGFWRNGFTPIVAGDARTNRDSITLARALGLQRVAIADRRGGDTTLVRAKMAELEAAALKQQIAVLERMIADPRAPVEGWRPGVLSSRPATLTTKADAMMTGLERAAAAGATDYYKTRDSGRTLAGLIAALPRDRFIAYGPRLLALYRIQFSTDPSGRTPQSHWLWASEPLLRRLGDLGTDALFIAIDPRASSGGTNDAEVETMCRIGAPGRDQSGPVLLDGWRKMKGYDRDQRIALFVAMRRIGIVPPPLVESDEDRKRRERGNAAYGGTSKQRASPMDELIEQWGDVTPASPARVCSPAEEQARREERFGGKRRTNLD